MNTRLQVEHPVTEAITGLDIVREQIHITAGARPGHGQERYRVRRPCHRECRINAENPFTFRPSPGTITQFHTPGGLGVRFDSAIYAGYRIPPYYDSLAGKLIVHARNRNECLLRLRRALDELVVGGIETTIPLFQKLVREPDIINGDYSIHWLEKYLASFGRSGLKACARMLTPVRCRYRRARKISGQPGPIGLTSIQTRQENPRVTVATVAWPRAMVAP